MIISNKIKYWLIISLASFIGAICIAATQHSSEDLKYAPSVFTENGQNFVPIDILDNQVKWKISSDLKEITATARVLFKVSNEGRPLLLLNSNARATFRSKAVDIHKMQNEEFSETNYHALDMEVKPGKRYEVDFEYSFIHDPLEEKTILPLEYYYGRFVERGIPANGTFDHFPTRLELEIAGKKEFEIYANGTIIKTGSGSYVVKYPDYMTSMGIFIDVVEESTKITDTLTSKIDGRKITMTVYSDGISKELEKSMSTQEVVQTFAGILKYKFHEQESFWGSFPFDSITLKISDKGAGTGAFSGAMVLSSDYMEDMSHEISHSYFLQSVTPARGEDTWIFEGLGDWAHLYGWRSGFAKDLNMENSVVLGTGPYKLWANKTMFPLSNLRTPHQTGRKILASFDQYIKQSGNPDLEEGLMPVLKEIHKRKKYQTITTAEFIELIEEITGLHGEISNLFAYYSTQK